MMRRCLLSIAAATLLLAGPARAGDTLPGRAFADRADNIVGPQVHLVYAVPSDGVDRQYDVNGTIAASFLVAQQWLGSQTGGRELRLDTYRAQPDISFVRLPETDAQLASFGVNLRDELERLLKQAGFDQPLKLYEVFYDGSSHDCGTGSWPPALPGRVVGLYLKGTPAGAAGCATNPFAAAGQPPGYWEMGEVHEIMHGLGFVPSCAPHFTASGHVSDSPTDLMYAGPLPWDVAHMMLDVGHDDYFDANIPGCLDLSNSAVLQGGTQLPPDWSCPSGETWSPPSCVSTPASCPAGQTGVPPNCVPTSSSCPVGQTGVPPNCVTPLPSCPVGQAGVPPPNCLTPTSSCPEGRAAVSPNCTTASPPACVVPRLGHMTLGQATVALRRAKCRLGTVRRSSRVRRHGAARVGSQSVPPRSRRPVGYAVDIRLT
jgi:hypothetical protein